MSHPTTTASPTLTATSSPRIAGRWMVSFLGFPVGGYAAFLLIGPVDDPLPALVGGLLTGAILGAAQVFGFGHARPPAGGWIATTALGLMVGLAVGAAAVAYETTLTALLIQGAVSGFAVGTAQTPLLLPRLGRSGLAWPVALGIIWAIGWAVTYSMGIQVDEQFTVFGSTGALVVTALTAPLALILTSTQKSSS